MSGEKVGRFLKMPEFLKGRFLEPILAVGIGQLRVKEIDAWNNFI